MAFDRFKWNAKTDVPGAIAALAVAAAVASLSSQYEFQDRNIRLDRVW